MKCIPYYVLGAIFSVFAVAFLNEQNIPGVLLSGLVAVGFFAEGSKQ